MASHVLITGGAGFIGSHVADELLRQGHRVRALDNLNPQVHGPERRRPAYLNPEVELIVGDVRDRNAVKSALAPKLREGAVLCLDALTPETPKTKSLAAALASGLGVKGKALLVAEDVAGNLELAARNHPRITAKRALGVEVVDLLEHDVVIFSEPALRALSEVLSR